MGAPQDCEACNHIPNQQLGEELRWVWVDATLPTGEKRVRVRLLLCDRCAGPRKCDCGETATLLVFNLEQCEACALTAVEGYIKSPPANGFKVERIVALEKS